jgi:CheY-like chemotaxis protein
VRFIICVLSFADPGRLIPGKADVRNFAAGGIGPSPEFRSGQTREKPQGCPDATGRARCQTGFVQSSAAILIVDDHDGFRALARGMLEAAGFTVAEAATGAEATEAARTVRPGLVLLDIQLPDFDGFEVARRLAAPAGDPAPVVVLTSTREARDYGARIARARRPGSCPKISSLARRCAGSWPGRAGNEPAEPGCAASGLIAGATAAVGCFVWSSWPPNSQYAPVEISFAVVGLSFMVAGIAAWQRWPASRLGLLFTIVGYLYLVPYILVNLANPAAWTIGNLSEGISGAALAHLGLAWPTGRLRSRFECGVVVADYVQNIAFNTAATMFWNPAFSGCNASCPANVLLIGNGSRPAWNTLNTIAALVGLVITGIVLTLIVRHWRSARGWSRRAMIPLLWIAPAVGAEHILTGNLFHFSATGHLRPAPAGAAGRPGPVRDQHGAGPDGGRRPRHRDRRPGTGCLAGPAPGRAGPGAG